MKHSSRSTATIAVQVNRGYFFDDAAKPKLGRAYPKHSLEDSAQAFTLSLLDALTTRFEFPAYLVGHQPTPVQRRISKDVLSKPEALANIGGAVRMHLMIADVDNHGLRPDEVEAWFFGERDKIAALLEAHPGLIVYRSQGGYRIVGALPEPFTIARPEDAAAWKVQTLQWVAYMARAFNIKVDPLHDFTRYQRVPHDTRQKGGQPEELEFIGDPEQIGVWQPELTPEDMKAAIAGLKTAPAQSKNSTRRPGPNDSAPRSSSTPTLFRIMLRNRGQLGDYDSGNRFFTITCPAEHEHSSPDEDPSGDDTVLYENDGDWGGIYCLHTNCGHESQSSAKFWQGFFSASEIAEAKREIAKDKKMSTSTPDWMDDAPAVAEEPADETAPESKLRDMAPPKVPDVLGLELPEPPPFNCAITVIPVKESTSDFNLANMILDQAERYVGRVIATEASPDVHVKLSAYSKAEGYFRTLPGSWLYDCIRQYEGSMTIAQKGAAKRRGEQIQDSDKWHANPRNIAAVTKNLTLESISRQKLRAGETFFGDAPPSAVFKNGSLVYVEGARRFAWTSHSHAHRARFRYEIDFQPGLVPQHTTAALRYSLRGQPEAEIDKCVEVLRASLGVALLGCYPLAMRSVWMLGRGRDGKGLWSEIVRTLLPEQWHSSVQPASLGDKVMGGSHAKQLIGKRANVVSEIQGAGSATSALKAALVCEPVETRVLRGNPERGTPKSVWIVDSNYPLPKVEIDAAWRDRWIMIRFNYQVPEQHRVIGMGKRLATLEYRELVCWAIEGALDLIANGGRYDLPACHREVMAAWASGAGSSNAAAFIEDMVSDGQLRPGSSQRSAPTLKALFGASKKGEPSEGYLLWCEDNAIQRKDVLARREFKAALQAIKGVAVKVIQNQDRVVIDESYAAAQSLVPSQSAEPGAARAKHAVDFTKLELVKAFEVAEFTGAPISTTPEDSFNDMVDNLGDADDLDDPFGPEHESF